MNKLFSLLFALFLVHQIGAQDQELKFNHLYFVLDSLTFNKIKNNQHLNSLGTFDKGLPKHEPIDKSATTLYLRGKTTYIEIMGPDNKFKEKVGAIGMGFSWDTNKIENNNLNSKLKSSCTTKFIPYEAKWSFENEKVLWYTSHYTELKGTVATWYAYYNPAFLTKMYKENHTKFTRELSLQKAYKNNSAIQDLSEVTLECSAEDFLKISTELDCFYTTKKNVDPNSITYIINNVKIQLKKSESNKTKIRQLTFQLDQKIDLQNFDFSPIQLVQKEDELSFQF